MAEGRRSRCHSGRFTKNIADLAPGCSVFLLVGQIRATASLELCLHGRITHSRGHRLCVLLLTAGNLFHEESCVRGCVDWLGRRFGH